MDATGQNSGWYSAPADRNSVILRTPFENAGSRQDSTRFFNIHNPKIDYDDARKRKRWTAKLTKVARPRMDLLARVQNQKDVYLTLELIDELTKLYTDNIELEQYLHGVKQLERARKNMLSVLSARRDKREELADATTLLSEMLEKAKLVALTSKLKAIEFNV